MLGVKSGVLPSVWAVGCKSVSYLLGGRLGKRFLLFGRQIWEADPTFWAEDLVSVAHYLVEDLRSVSYFFGW